jgi:L-rhamnose isomerase
MILVHELVHHVQAAARGCVDEACALEDEAIRLHMALVRNDLPTALTCSRDFGPSIT